MFFFSLWNPLLQEIYSNFQTCQSYQESPNFQGKILYSLLCCEKPWLLNISGGLPFAFAVFQITAWTKGAQNDGEGRRWTQHTDSHRTICMARISSRKLILLSKAQLDGHFMGNASTPCLFPIPAREFLFFLLRLCFPQSIWKMITHRHCRYLFTETMLEHMAPLSWFMVCSASKIVWSSHQTEELCSTTTFFWGYITKLPT